MIVCIFSATCHLWSILIGVFLSLPEILQVSPSKAIYLLDSSSSLGQNAHALLPSPANQDIHCLDLTITSIDGTSYSAHIESMNLCTSEHESTLGQELCIGILKKLYTALITFTTAPNLPPSGVQGGPSIYTFW